jgi:2-dehydropantoate 2-reductase
MRAAIYGAGSMGTILGAYITKNGGHIDLVNHNFAHIHALQEKGAHIVGTVNFVQPVKAISPFEMAGTYNIIILLTKQMENEKIVRFLIPYLTPDGVIVTLQNGIPELLISQIVGPDHVLGCTVAWGATLLEPGVSELTSDPDSLTFQLGSLSPFPNRHLNDVKELLELMGPVTVEDNFIGTRWTKLLINASFSGLSTALGCTFGEAIRPKDSRRITLALIKECIDVARKGNIRFEPVQGKDVITLLDFHNPLKKYLAFAILPLTMRKHMRLKASMLQDIEKGRRCEVDAINGVVCSAGREVSVPTPLNDMVVDVIHRIERKELKPCRDNIRFFLPLLK